MVGAEGIGQTLGGPTRRRGQGKALRRETAAHQAALLLAPLAGHAERRVDPAVMAQAAAIRSIASMPLAAGSVR